MGLRPGRCYRKPHRPWTRQSRRKPRKGYVKGVPGSKIHQFNVGNILKDYDKKIFLKSDQDIQIRHNSLEAARIAAVHYLDTKLGQGNYFLRIRPYPHHVMRENPLATGAGADRFQQGMRSSFGKPIGMAAIVKKGQIIMEVWLNKNQVDIGKEAFKRAKYKLPLKYRLLVKDIEKKSVS